MHRLRKRGNCVTCEKGMVVKMSKEYGYVRVSTREQNEDRQLIAMAEAGVRE